MAFMDFNYWHSYLVKYVTISATVNSELSDYHQ